LRQICCPIACARRRSRAEPNQPLSALRPTPRRLSSTPDSVYHEKVTGDRDDQRQPAESDEGHALAGHARTNIFTPTEAGTFEAVFTLTDPVTGMTRQVTFTIVIAAA
jgi:hypothetical protein